MKTRCPHCDTLYNIDDATLASADYTAVCCQCHRVFAAEPTLKPEETLQTPPTGAEQTDTLAKTEKVATDIAEKPERSSEAIEDEWAFVQENTKAALNNPAPSPTDEVPEDFSSLAAAEVPEHHFSTPQQAKSKSGFLFITGVFLLSLLCVAQLAWINRQQLIKHPQGHQLIQQICDLAGCKLERQITTDKFRVLYRDLQPAINHPDTLSLTLSFTNDAEFSQPIPQLQLSLLDYDDLPVAQRSFTPDEYLYPTTGNGRAMEPWEIINVELLLQNSDLRISGFRLEFL